MIEKRIGNMAFAYFNSGTSPYEEIEIYSYHTQIAKIYINRDGKRFRYFDSYFYSNTTRKHQGLAFAVITARYSLYRIFSEISNCKSLKDLREFFGYVPTKAWKNGIEYFNITEY